MVLFYTNLILKIINQNRSCVFMSVYDLWPDVAIFYDLSKKSCSIFLMYGIKTNFEQRDGADKKAGLILPHLYRCRKSLTFNYPGGRLIPYLCLRSSQWDDLEAAWYNHRHGVLQPRKCDNLVSYSVGYHQSNKGVIVIICLCWK